MVMLRNHLSLKAKPGTSSNPIPMPPESNELSQRLIAGLELTRKRLIAFKKSKGTPLVILREGQIVHVPASDLPDPS